MGQNPSALLGQNSIAEPWGEPDIDIAATLIRQIAENPSEALAVGECGRKTVIGRLSAAAVAETIRSCFVTTREEQETKQIAPD